MGSYRNSPFATGGFSFDNHNNGTRTEILDYKAKKWNRQADYPYSTGNRFSKIDLHQIQHDNKHLKTKIDDGIHQV